MLLKIKLKNLLITLIFTSIFAEITGMQSKADREAKKKKKIDKKNKETEGLCETLGNYYGQYPLNPITIEFYKTKKGKGLKYRVNRGNRKRKGTGKHFRSHDCHDSSEYNAFSEYYSTVKKNAINNLQCDLIRPKLPLVPNIKCQSIGEYFLQFGVDMYYSFFKYLNNIGKKNRRGFFSKLMTKHVKSYIKRYEAGQKKDQHLKRLQADLNDHYKVQCETIIPHYNAFYTFYTEIYIKDKKHHIETPKCDFFERLTTK